MKKKLSSDRKYEVIDGVKYEYPCWAKGHKHVLDCCTVEMWDAASEIAYATK